MRIIVTRGSESNDPTKIAKSSCVYVCVLARASVDGRGIGDVTADARVLRQSENAKVRVRLRVCAHACVCVLCSQSWGR